MHVSGFRRDMWQEELNGNIINFVCINILDLNVQVRHVLAVSHLSVLRFHVDLG